MALDAELPEGRISVDRRPGAAAGGKVRKGVPHSDCLRSPTPNFAAALVLPQHSHPLESFPSTLPSPSPLLLIIHPSSAMAPSGDPVKHPVGKQPVVKLPLRGNAFAQKDFEDQLEKARRQAQNNLRAGGQATHPAFRSAAEMAKNDHMLLTLNRPQPVKPMSKAEKVLGTEAAEHIKNTRKSSATSISSVSSIYSQDSDSSSASRVTAIRYPPESFPLYRKPVASTRLRLHNLAPIDVVKSNSNAYIRATVGTPIAQAAQFETVAGAQDPSQPSRGTLPARAIASAPLRPATRVSLPAATRFSDQPAASSSRRRRRPVATPVATPVGSAMASGTSGSIAIGYEPSPMAREEQLAGLVRAVAELGRNVMAVRGQIARLDASVAMLGRREEENRLAADAQHAEFVQLARQVIGMMANM